MGKETFYFSHDYNARSDERIRRLLWKHGMVGYGLFWAIVEDLYQNDNRLMLDIDRLAHEYRSDKSILESVINDFDLFVFDRIDPKIDLQIDRIDDEIDHFRSKNNEIDYENQSVFFGSLSVQKRIEERNSKSIKARESVGYRWDNTDRYERITNVLRTNSIRNTIKESKVKDNKVKESKVNTDTAFAEIYPTFDDFWNSYQKKIDKPKTEKAWSKLSQAEKEKAIMHVQDYVHSTPDVQFRKNPLTYLNSKSFENEIITPNQSKQIGSNHSNAWLGDLADAIRNQQADNNSD